MDSTLPEDALRRIIHVLSWDSSHKQALKTLFKIALTCEEMFNTFVWSSISHLRLSGAHLLDMYLTRLHVMSYVTFLTLELRGDALDIAAQLSPQLRGLRISPRACQSSLSILPSMLDTSKLEYLELSGLTEKLTKEFFRHRFLSLTHLTLGSVDALSEVPKATGNLQALELNTALQQDFPTLAARLRAIAVANPNLRILALDFHSEHDGEHFSCADFCEKKAFDAVFAEHTIYNLADEMQETLGVPIRALKMFGKSAWQQAIIMRPQRFCSAGNIALFEACHPNTDFDVAIHLLTCFLRDETNTVEACQTNRYNRKLRLQLVLECLEPILLSQRHFPCAISARGLQSIVLLLSLVVQCRMREKSTLWFRTFQRFLSCCELSPWQFLSFVCENTDSARSFGPWLRLCLADTEWAESTAILHNISSPDVRSALSYMLADYPKLWDELSKHSSFQLQKRKILLRKTATLPCSRNISLLLQAFCCFLSMEESDTKATLSRKRASILEYETLIVTLEGLTQRNFRYGDHSDASTWIFYNPNDEVMNNFRKRVTRLLPDIVNYINAGALAMWIQSKKSFDGLELYPRLNQKPMLGQPPAVWKAVFYHLCLNTINWENLFSMAIDFCYPDADCSSWIRSRTVVGRMLHLFGPTAHQALLKLYAVKAASSEVSLSSFADLVGFSPNQDEVRQLMYQL